MTERADLIRAFADGEGWSGAAIRPLAGDASNRRYFRLERAGGETAVVMDAPPETGEDIRPFVAIDGFLCEAGLSAPRILASDEAAGLLILEDLGDALFAQVLKKTVEQEKTLYLAAVEALVELHRHGVPQVVGAYDTALMTDRAALAYEWYLGGSGSCPSEAQTTAFRGEIADRLGALAPGCTVLALRDYHAENLIWLPDRDGPRRVGLLDFQDGLAGHPAYDLVSLLEDARRDVAGEVRIAALHHFLDLTGHAAEPFGAAAAVLSAQRNLRILGVFARLSLLYGKPSYVRLIPRVWRNLTEDLDHPALAGLRRIVLRDLPEPSPAILSQLEARCATASP